MSMTVTTGHTLSTRIPILLQEGNKLTDGKTPLYIAFFEEHENVVKLLLNNGADPNVPNITTISKALISCPGYCSARKCGRFSRTV